MFRRSQEVSERGYGWFQYAPTNLLIYAIRDTRRGLKWGIPAMLLLGGGYIYGIAICTVIISREGPSALYLLVLLFFWNAMKFIWLGPVSLQRLIIARRQEAKDRRNAEDEGEGEGEGEGDQKGTTTMQTMQSMTCNEVA